MIKKILLKLFDMPMIKTTCVPLKIFDCHFYINILFLDCYDFNEICQSKNEVWKCGIFPHFGCGNNCLQRVVLFYNFVTH